MEAARDEARRARTEGSMEEGREKRTRMQEMMACHDQEFDDAGGNACNDKNNQQVAKNKSRNEIRSTTSVSRAQTDEFLDHNAVN